MVDRAGDAPPEIIGHDDGVVAHVGLKPLHATSSTRFNFYPCVANALDTAPNAFEKNFVLIREVVVDGRLGDFQRLGDIIERRRVKALLVEKSNSRPEHSLALQLAVPVALLAARPW